MWLEYIFEKLFFIWIWDIIITSTFSLRTLHEGGKEYSPINTYILLHTALHNFFNYYATNSMISAYILQISPPYAMQYLFQPMCYTIYEPRAQHTIYKSFCTAISQYDVVHVCTGFLWVCVDLSGGYSAIVLWVYLRCLRTDPMSEFTISHFSSNCHIEN